MEKRILVAGCSRYLREYLRNGFYCLSNEYYLRMLYKGFDVYNLSKRNLSSKEALLLIKAFLKTNTYSYCVISLGEGDLDKNVSKEEFKRNLREILSLCNYYQVKIILQDTVDFKALHEYQEAIDELRNLYNLDKETTRKALLAI